MGFYYGIMKLKNKYGRIKLSGENMKVYSDERVENLNGVFTITDAKIILADEPTGNLDTKNGEIVLNELKKLTTLGKTVVLITHNIDDAKKYSDKIILLKDGVISNENN